MIIIVRLILVLCFEALMTTAVRHGNTAHRINRVKKDFLEDIYENLVTEECLDEYKEILDEIEPIKEEEILRVQKSDNEFDAHAGELQIPGYPERRNSRRIQRGLKKIHKANRRQTRLQDIEFILSDYNGPTGDTPDRAAEAPGDLIETTELIYRHKKGLRELHLCELETYYVRRYNKFPYFVKSVSCQKNDAITGGKIGCKERYEKGHILRLENMRTCYNKDNRLKWVHAWEMRVVGCDAVLYSSPKRN